MACYPEELETALAEELAQFAALFNVILNKQRANLDHNGGRFVELRMHSFIMENCCTLLFQILKLLFAYTCASWFPNVLESGLFQSCVELRIIF